MLCCLGIPVPRCLSTSVVGLAGDLQLLGRGVSEKPQLARGPPNLERYERGPG